ncbi:MAG: DUF2244 domain-containing protein [Geminicoccaceae bacterium]
MSESSTTFEAVLYPNQPLGRYGFQILMGSFIVVSTAVSLGFYLMGAWPVAGFFGLDVLLVWWAFRVVQRRARRTELIRLGEEGLSVAKVEANGQAREWRFEPHWVRVHMDDPPKRDSSLLLASHGRRLSIGHFLTPDEKLDLAQALRAALQPYQ